VDVCALGHMPKHMNQMSLNNNNLIIRFHLVKLLCWFPYDVLWLFCIYMTEPHHLIIYICDCLGMPIGFILLTHWVAFWQSLDLHVQILKFGSRQDLCWGPGLFWRASSLAVDPFRALSCPAHEIPYSSWASFVLYILCKSVFYASCDETFM